MICELRGIVGDRIDIQHQFKALKAERMVGIEMSKVRYVETSPVRGLKCLKSIAVFSSRKYYCAVSLSVWRSTSWDSLRGSAVGHSEPRPSFVAQGYTAVLNFAPPILSQIGLSGDTISLLAPGVIGIIFFLVTAPAVFLIEDLRLPLIKTHEFPRKG